MSLTLLPAEIVQLVALSLPLSDLICLAKTCKWLRRLINQKQFQIAKCHYDYPHLGEAELLTPYHKQHLLAGLLEPIRRQSRYLWGQLEQGLQIMELLDSSEIKPSLSDLKSKFPLVAKRDSTVVVAASFIRSTEPMSRYPSLIPKLQKAGYFSPYPSINVQIILYLKREPVEYQAFVTERPQISTPYSTKDPNNNTRKLKQVKLIGSLREYLDWIRRQGYWPCSHMDQIPPSLNSALEQNGLVGELIK